MRVSVLAVGRLKAGPESELCARYLDRAARSGKALGLRGFEVQELAESRAPRAADRIVQEGEALLQALPPGARFACLDAGGELLDSEAFADLLRRSADAGVPSLAFIIGGPDGLAEAAKNRADRRISFGRVTWPHQLVRIMLAEQLYRAMTILGAHPYHRA